MLMIHRPVPDWPRGAKKLPSPASKSHEASILAKVLQENGTFLSGFPMFVPSLSW
jgi:hypothetical protein